MHVIQRLGQTGAAIGAMVGCQSIQTSMPIDPEEYLDTVEIVQHIPPGAVFITPVGLRSVHRRWLIVDLAIQGPKRSVLQLALIAHGAFSNRADGWIEIDDPKGRPINLVTFSDRREKGELIHWEPPRQVGLLRRRMDDETIRIIESCSVEVENELPSGVYILKLRSELPEEDIPGTISALAVDARVRRIELVRRRLGSPGRSADR